MTATATLPAPISLASFISLGGGVIQPSELLISVFAFSQINPKVAFDGTYFLAVWMDYWKDASSTFSSNVVFGIRLTATGQPVDPSGLLISGAASYKESLAVCGNPNQFLVAWADRRNSPADPGDKGNEINTRPALHCC